MGVARNVLQKIGFLTVLAVTVSAVALLFFEFARDAAPLVQERHYDNANASFSFFVAGHIYADCCRDNDYVGIHAPFKAKIGDIGAIPGMSFGFLTGDAVIASTQKHWAEFDSAIAALEFPIFLAPGNHDKTGDQRYVIERFGQPFRSFVHEENLFIVLDTNLDDGRITGSQLDFLKTTLSAAGRYANVFIFVHHVIWWREDNSFRDVKINYRPSETGSPNFWQDVEPLLRRAKTDVYVFAGDVGGRSDHLPSYFRYDNIRLIASGMRGGRNDNFLVVTVNTDKTVGIDLMWLHEPTERGSSIEEFIPGRR